LTNPRGHVEKTIQCKETCDVLVTAQGEVRDDVEFRTGLMQFTAVWAGENEGRRKRRVTWGTVYRTIYDEAPALQVDGATRHDDTDHSVNDDTTLQDAVHTESVQRHIDLQPDDARPRQPTPSVEGYPQGDEPSVQRRYGA
jgi:hypothetical protein